MHRSQPSGERRTAESTTFTPGAVSVSSPDFVVPLCVRPSGRELVRFLLITSLSAKISPSISFNIPLSSLSLDELVSRASFFCREEAALTPFSDELLLSLCYLSANQCRQRLSRVCRLDSANRPLHPPGHSARFAGHCCSSLYYWLATLLRVGLVAHSMNWCLSFYYRWDLTESSMVPMAGMSFDLFEEAEFVSDLASSLLEHTPAQERQGK